ncbi:MAG: ABC transporter permease [Chloroflexi bacterium]|nr:ABC transporter permease [Chloroflexota bacterium]
MSLLIFLMLRLLPGDVVDLMTAGNVDITDATKQKLRDAFGLSDPLPVQYLKWIGNLLHGDPGTSLRSGQPIRDALAQALPVTLELTILAVLMATALAIPLGVLSATPSDTAADVLSRTAGVVGLSVPSFWLATLMLLFTSLVFHWIPPVTFVPFFSNPVGNLQQMALPAAALACS